jgi:hypothetical protein
VSIVAVVVLYIFQCAVVVVALLVVCMSCPVSLVSNVWSVVIVLCQ